MARKKMTKKANKVSVKVKRKTKQALLTVAQTLKQLPKQFKKELAVLKKQAAQLASAIKKAEKQKKKAGVVLTKNLTPKKLKAAQKAYDQIDSTIENLMLESEVINSAFVLLSEKQEMFATLTDTAAKKPKKQKKSKLMDKAQKKVAAKVKSPKQEAVFTPDAEMPELVEEDIIVEELETVND